MRTTFIVPNAGVSNIDAGGVVEEIRLHSIITGHGDNV